MSYDPWHEYNISEINSFHWSKIGSTTIQFNCPLEAALSEWCVRWLVSRVHSHTSSRERHADGRGMTGEDDCVITQVQEHVALLVKFNSQTSQFQMFHSESLEWFREGVWTPLTAPHSWLLYLSYITFAPHPPYTGLPSRQNSLFFPVFLVFSLCFLIDKN